MKGCFENYYWEFVIIMNLLVIFIEIGFWMWFWFLFGMLMWFGVYIGIIYFCNLSLCIVEFGNEFLSEWFRFEVYYDLVSYGECKVFEFNICLILCLK